MKTNKNGLYGYDLVKLWCSGREKAYVNIYCQSLLDMSESIPVLSDKVIYVPRFIWYRENYETFIEVGGEI